MTQRRRRFPHLRALMTMLFLIGSMLAAPVLADEPFATPVTDADPPVPEVVPVESDRQVLVDDPPGSEVPPDDGPPPVERAPGTDAEPSIVEPSIVDSGPVTAIEPLTTFHLTITESTGRTLVFPDGQTACFALLLDPPEAHGSPSTVHCISGIDGLAEVYGGMPDVRYTDYMVEVSSNATACDFRVGAPVVTELGSGLSQVDIDVEATCPEDLSDPPRQYSGIGVEVSDASGLDRTYPGEICIDIVTSTALAGLPLPPYCISESYSVAIANRAGDIFPRDTVYGAIVLTNTTGCTPTWTFREAFVPPGVLVVGLISVVLTCEPPASESYLGIGVTLTDSTGVDTTYDGELCIDVAITPAVTIPGAVPQCFTGSYAQSGYPANGAVLPFGSTYEGVIVSNTTGCEVTWTTRDETIPPSGPVETGPILVDPRDELPADPPPSSSPGGVMLVVDVVIDCDEEPVDDPEYLAQIGIAFSDERDGDYTYPGEVCVDVRIDPIAGASTTQRYCTGATFMYRLFPGDFFTYLASSTYTTSLVSNATGCAATIDPFLVFSYFGTPIGHIQVRIDCDDPGEEPEPSATATATPTVTPGVTPSATATATATPVSSETPVATTTSEPSPPAADSTHAVPKNTLAVSGGELPATTGTTRVVGLPNTGAGEDGAGALSSALVILTGLSLLALIAGGTVRREDRRLR